MNSNLVCIIYFFIGLLVAYFIWGKEADSSEYADRYLIFAIDVSGSIDYQEYALQREAYVQVLRDQDIIDILDGTYIAIIEFAGEAKLVYSFTNNYIALADAYEAHRVREEMPSFTDPFAAVQLALALFAGVNGIKTFDISGDGISTTSTNRGGYGAYKGMATRPSMNSIIPAWKQALNDAGVTSNALIINDRQGHIKWWYNRAIVNGFVIDSVGIEDFYEALRKKLRMEIM